ncbi:MULTISPECIES: LuxR C-terminal-related transcriptional regulator [Enterobacterales]|uniref:LuxR C-terminal-related transcriptional regulator n=1 Tax=Enterobacterales TaxID=91347 RepID=UPI0008481412|nr:MULTISPECIES: LuxR C-terminal-related transcriptional regulator [Enterobacterales]WOO48262.1 LuxR C-terminal-related transcriptional regulator [Hafnia alvei]MCK9781543.1 LuxR C-terminal-related transcriptional regulator [Proteus columbae]MCT6516139.1 LuxR C-terminal-related transcriptional regulator [Proteus vulgaris]ODQ05274.1 response regulator [Shigella sp. FC130]OEI92726.1 response regulator [Shigella sp. FC1655]
MINTLIISRVEIFSLGIKILLSQIKKINVRKVMNDENDAFRYCRQFSVNLIIIYSTPSVLLIDSIKKIKRSSSSIKIIVISPKTDSILSITLLQLGIEGFIIADTSCENILQAIRQVCIGQRYISQELAMEIALTKLQQELNPLHHLSERELQIMSMIIRGKKITQIASELNINTKTVNSYRYRMFSKLKISGDVELTHIAIRYGLIEIESHLQSGRQI